MEDMIIYAIKLLDELDEPLKVYGMRVKEWYGLHFPELAEIVPDNILYAQSVLLMGNRAGAATSDFSDILGEDVEADVKEAAAALSRGTDINDLDVLNIRCMCEQFLSLSEYSSELNAVLEGQMNTVAPNLTTLVGARVGARLIRCKGSLEKLSKQPASLVHTFGAEKALRTTPELAFIFQAPMIAQAAPRDKRKLSRSLAAKAVLAIRCDALTTHHDAHGLPPNIALHSLERLRARLRHLGVPAPDINF